MPRALRRRVSAIGAHVLHAIVRASTGSVAGVLVGALVARVAAIDRRGFVVVEASASTIAGLGVGALRVAGVIASARILNAVRYVVAAAVSAFATRSVARLVATLAVGAKSTRALEGVVAIAALCFLSHAGVASRAIEAAGAIFLRRAGGGACRRGAVTQIG